MTHSTTLRLFTRFCFACLILIIPMRISAQCTNWAASATLTAASFCAANGSFTVALTGPDVVNLSNIQYGIPLAANGFSLPLNSSPNFTGIPPGACQVSVVAECGGVPVGRNTTIVVPGSYTPPVWNISGANTRRSLNCAATGQLTGYVSGGVAPFTFTLLTYPAAYTGPTTATVSTYFHQFRDLPPGSYSIQVSDACQSGTIPASYTIGTLTTAVPPINFISFGTAGCDSLILRPPTFFASNPLWDGYEYDTSFKFSMEVSGGLLSPTPSVRWPDTNMVIRLPAGQSISNLYGDTVTYTVTPPCGPQFTAKRVIQSPTFSTGVSLRCDTDFIATLNVGPYLCAPVSYTLRNTGTNVSYGPFMASNTQYVTPPLPLGTYTATYTTADGYSGSRTFTVNPVAAKPYSVQVLLGAPGVHNFANGFYFYDSLTNTGGPKTLELFSGPAGYSYSGLWGAGQRDFSVLSNQSPTPSTVKFPPGNYVWKITDDCGVYYLPVSVTAQDLYQYTISAPTQKLTCQGLWITPAGTASHNGTARPVRFFLYLNGQPHYVRSPTGVTSWPSYPAGTPILLTAAGTYSIVACETGPNTSLAGFFNPGGFSVGFPNIHTASYTFTYTPQPLAFDINQTQGFLCKGALSGQGQIHATARGGIMLPTPSPHYDYYLALPGNALSGPYIASNSSGVFTGFGANANALYDVKVVDSCGAFAVQQVKILDLGTARLITSSHYVGCIGNNIRLSAVYLPNATYSWTGPAGFSSTVRQPLIPNAGPMHAGVYRVTISTTLCNQAMTDSTTIVISQNPPKPLLSYNCRPRPVVLSVSNAAAGAVYKWDIGRVTAANGLIFVHDTLQHSDAPWTKKVLVTGSYAPVAIDTLTGCSTKGDSLVFLSNPTDSLKAGIYSPHLQLCTGDSTILAARWSSGALNPAFQWYRNGLPISGATGLTYTTSLAGSYRVLVYGGPCNTDTSAAVTLSVVAPPLATLTASKDSICQGDTAMLQAATGAGYSYVWHRNGSVIPGAYAPVYAATQAGNYFVMVANGACISSSAMFNLTVTAPPNVVLSPATPQTICGGAAVRFSTAPGALYAYSWSRNGTVIPGATTDTFHATQPGLYRVIVSTAQCPHTASPAVPVNVLPVNVSLGNDTSICADTAFPVPLAIGEGFAQILWSTGESAAQINAPGPGRYWVSAQNICGTYRDTIQIYTKADHDPGLPDDTLVCSSTGITRLSVPQHLQQVLWSTGAVTSSIVIDTPGTYWVDAQTPCGPVHDTVRVSFCRPEIRGIQLSADSICEGDCITITAAVFNSPRSYQWIFPGGDPASSFSASPGTVCYTKAGVYPVLLIAVNKGGPDTAETSVVVSARPLPRFKDTAVIARYGSSITLPACAAAQTVDWYRGDSLVCANCPQLHLDARYYEHTYRCVVRNGDCPDTCTYSLRVIDIPRDLWLPDAFTPNGDSRNDIFRIITDNPNIEVINLAVYNRWGQHVFSSNKSRDGWDGTWKGVPAAGGTYFWQLRYRILGTQEVILSKGDVLLVR